MTTKEMIEVMQAYEDGKTIECTYGEGDEWDVVQAPSWNWSDYDYRIKPEKKYRPYEDADEMIADWKARFNVPDWPSYSMPFIWIRHKATNITCLIYDYWPDSVAVGVARPSFLALLEDYTYLDGSPCGKEIT